MEEKTPQQILDSLSSILSGKKLDELTLAKMLDVGDLLVECKDRKCYAILGYDSYERYQLETLGVQARVTQYLTRISRECKRLNISRAALLKCKFSCLKIIFSTASVTDEQKVQLVARAPKWTFTHCRDEVNKLNPQKATYGESDDLFAWFNIKVLRDNRTEVIEPAFEKMRKQCGDAFNSFGTRIEVSNGKILELMCAEKLAEPDEASTWVENFAKWWAFVRQTTSWMLFEEESPNKASTLSQFFDKLSSQ